MVFLPGTAASLVMADGTTRPLPAAHVRATEYTVGATGPAAMPATLPPTSAYTYAVDLSVDEAAPAGASGARLSTGPDYVDDFLHFPAGTTVPVGYYDPAKGAWVASDSGIVLTIVSVTAGKADLDLDGTGNPATAAALTAAGIGDLERQTLARTYPIGTRLWRAAITHFSAWDLNWGWDFPLDSQYPNQDEPNPPPPDPCKAAGSIIGCETQTLGETTPVAGTPFTLNYQSDRVPGRAATLRIPLSGATISFSVARIDLDVTVAGQHTTQSFAPAINLATTYQWNGLDAYGRHPQGDQTATIRISYVYQPVYSATGRFGRAGTETHGLVGLLGDRARQELYMVQTYTVPVGGLGRGSRAGRLDPRRAPQLRPHQPCVAPR